MGLPILGDNDKEPTETSVQIAGVVHEEVPDTQVHYDDVFNNADVEPEHESNRSTPDEVEGVVETVNLELKTGCH